LAALLRFTDWLESRLPRILITVTQLSLVSLEFIHIHGVMRLVIPQHIRKCTYLFWLLFDNLRKVETLLLLCLVFIASLTNQAE
jgi:hypothetical protein